MLTPASMQCHLSYRILRGISKSVVYARHGHELMGWKSPVGVPAVPFWTNITTSRRQRRPREGLSEGSPSAKVQADEQKPHRRLSLRASQHKMTKPTGYRR